jgi:hypothetical protein
MPVCAVCAHEARHQIECGLVAGTPMRVLARRFGLSRDSVQRHSSRHLTPQIRAAIATAMRPEAIDLPQLQKTEGEGLLTALIHQRARLALAGQQAQQFGNVADQCRVEGRILDNLEVTGRLLNQFEIRHVSRHEHLLVSPDYVRLRQALSTALRPYPEAAGAVAAALGKLEMEAAEEITKANGKLIEHQPEVLP